MAKERMDVLELLRKEAVDADLDFLREGLRVLMQAVMEAEVERKTGRGPWPWDTRVGTLDLQIPKVREGSHFPSLLEPRRRSERALLAVVQQAYVEGVSTRRVEELVQALGCEGISTSQVSRICSELDGVVGPFLGRPLDGGPYPYLYGRLDPEGARGRPDRQRQRGGGHRRQPRGEARGARHRRRRRRRALKQSLASLRGCASARVTGPAVR